MSRTTTYKISSENTPFRVDPRENISEVKSVEIRFRRESIQKTLKADWVDGKIEFIVPRSFFPFIGRWAMEGVITHTDGQVRPTKSVAYIEVEA